MVGSVVYHVRWHGACSLMFIPLRDFGTYGVITDRQDESLPVGAWTDARNMRFSDGEVEKMLEPIVEESTATIIGTPMWMEQWTSGVTTFTAVATATSIWLLEATSDTQSERREVGVGYQGGPWSSFEWGDTVIFHEPESPPQMYDYTTGRFVDLPEWGMISTANQISLRNEPVPELDTDADEEAYYEALKPARDTNLRCKVLRPYKNFLVAVGVTEQGNYSPNGVWWSNTTPLATYKEGGPPNWDYEDPGSLSGKTEIGLGEGPLVAAEILNENLICYTTSSASALTFTGGALVMSVRRLFQKGAAAQHCVAEFQNQHLVVSRETIYTHDGSTVSQLGKGVIEEAFYKRLGPGDYERIQVIKNPIRKEVSIVFDADGELV